MWRIVADSVDDLYVEAIRLVLAKGQRVESRRGRAQQITGVELVLTKSRNRLLSLRAPGSVRYLARETLAYFRGSLKVDGGLSRASQYWKEVADEHGNINSNYGFYIFHQKIGEHTQLEWVLECLGRNRQSRRAFININQVHHKVLESLDYPCVVGAHYFIEGGQLNSYVYSRSTDVVWGLPYDIGFFSIVSEILLGCLRDRHKDLELGYTSLISTFVQIYDQTRDLALRTVRAQKKPIDAMPKINEGAAVLQDIYGGTASTRLLQWLKKKAELPASK